MIIKAAGRCLSVALLFSFLLWSAGASALSGTLSPQDLIRLLNDYTNSGNARKQALAVEFHQRLAGAGVSITSNGFVVAGEIPPDPTPRELLRCSELQTVSIGDWTLGIGPAPWTGPNAGPTSGRITGGVFSVLVDGNATTLGFGVTSGHLSIGLTVAGSYAADVRGIVNWEWGYMDPFGLCGWTIFGPVCGPLWRCSDAGTEGYRVAASGSFRAEAALNIDAVLEQNASGRYQIVFGRQALANPAAPFSAGVDLRLNTSIHTSFRPGAPLWAGANSIVETEAADAAREKLNEKFADVNSDIREKLPVVLELPQIDPAILKLVVDIVGSPALTRFIEENFTPIVFYILVNDRVELSRLVASGAACEATRLARASMAMPSLYSNVSGSCVAANPEGPDLGRYFANSTCTQELAFRPMPQSEYCNEMLAPTPNPVLGNAAAWTPDANQPNDPLPSVPSRKWTVPQGPQMAITAESLSGKTAPMMKRLRWRDIPQSWPLSNITPLYWDCLQWSYGPDNDFCVNWGPLLGSAPPSAAFLGYIKTMPEPGTAPLYLACTFDGENGCTRWELVTSGYSNASLVGYIRSSAAPGTAALYWDCLQWSYGPENDFCVIWGPRVGSSPQGSPVGYLYSGTSVPRPNCVLEMRVYKKDPTATGLTPLIAFHGGSWQYRGAAFAGFEAEMAHFTQNGFVVFAPFYRLAGSADGNEDCNGAPWEHVVGDAEAALDWVKAHGQAFGAKPGKPAVAGMSAGAHLAGWLVTHRPAEVAAGMLLYPPSDVRDFLVHGHAGGLYEPFLPSLGILSKFYGADVTTIDLGNPPEFLRQNSFHDLVRAGGSAIPPVFVLHGLVDTLVPSNQSVQLCNAYGGSAVNDGGGGNRRAIYNCGASGSRLHLFQQAEHPLDICVINEPLNVCFSGDNDSRVLVANSMSQARNFLISKVNLGPTANAGANTTAAAATAVTLNGSGTDTDGTIVSYTWTQIGGPPVTLVNAGTPNASFTTPIVGTATVLTFLLTVTDNNGNQDSVTVTVTVPASGLVALPAILQLLLEE